MSRRGRNSKLLIHPTPIGMQIGIGQGPRSAMIAVRGLVRMGWNSSLLRLNLWMNRGREFLSELNCNAIRRQPARCRSSAFEWR